MKFLFFCVISNLLLGNMSFADEKEAYLYLDNLANRASTDKSSRNSGFSSPAHNYTLAYAKYFDKVKDKPLKFLEIGISSGNSVKLWEAYFPNAELHFIDLHRHSIKYFSERSKYHFLDQASKEHLLKFIEDVGSNFDIIIDDGGHSMVQQKTSFRMLFPHVKPGGIYVIEDLHTSYWNEYGGNGTKENPKAGAGTTVGFLQGLVDEMNYTAACTGCANPNVRPNTSLNYYQEQIESIHFYKSMCFIFKKK